MIMKIVIIIVMLLILASLGSALFYMLRNKGQPEQVAKMLTLRIGLAFSLFVFLFIAYALGWITPHAL